MLGPFDAPTLLRHAGKYGHVCRSGRAALKMPVSDITAVSIVDYATTELKTTDVDFRQWSRTAYLKNGMGGYLQMTGVWGYGTVEDTVRTASTPTDPAGSVYEKSDANELVFWDGTRFENLTHTSTFTPSAGYKLVVPPLDLQTASLIIAQNLPNIEASGSMKEVLALDSGITKPDHPLIPQQAYALLELYR